MKNYILIALAIASGIQASAQRSGTDYLGDAELSRWVIDLNLLGGLSNQVYTSPNSTSNYLNAVNANPGSLKFNNGTAYGADGQIGFFFGKNRHFGVGTGLMYLMQNGDATLNNFHMESQAIDFNGSTYRQVITGNNIKENLAITNVNIPLVLKYKNRFSKRWGVAADAGILYNVQMKNEYTTHASFDYEAIYQFTSAGDAPNTAVYDNSPTPSVNDWLITKAEFLKNNPNGNIQDYFNAKQALGYNVGLNQSVTNAKGTVSYPTGNIGLLFQPSVNYFLSDKVALNFGVYYVFQPFATKTNNAYHLTDAVGSYNSVLNNTTKVDNQSYGLNLGVRFFLGHKKEKMSISSEDQMAPSKCGLTDGFIVLNGLHPDRQVSVDYKLNGVDQKTYSANVSGTGQVKMDNLGPGDYSAVTVSIRKEKVTANPFTLSSPTMVAPVELTANPTTSASCNGFVMFRGLNQGSSVNMTYSLNGTAHVPYSGLVDHDNILNMSGLCAGTYTQVVASAGACSVACPDFTLASPGPQNLLNTGTNAAPDNSGIQNAKAVPCEVDISTPMLFDVNLYVLHAEAYQVIEKAVALLKTNKGSMISIEGNADSTGEEAKNVPLSMNRAMAVKDELTKRGVKANRIKTIGHGSRDPVATNRTHFGKQENRNAVMTLKPAKDEVIVDEQK